MGVKGIDIMKQAKQMARRLEQIKEELSQKTVEVTVGGGMVKIVANGDNQVVKIDIAREAIDPDDKEMLEDLIILAVNDVMRRVKEMVDSEMSTVTGGITLPGMF